MNKGSSSQELEIIRKASDSKTFNSLKVLPPVKKTHQDKKKNSTKKSYNTVRVEKTSLDDRLNFYL